MSVILKIFVKRISHILILLPILLWGQTVLINEILSSNHGDYEDEDGDTPDWIELFNPSSSMIDLDGFGLSDNLDDPYKWSFEGGTIAAGGHLVVFASGKNRQSSDISWNLNISQGDVWQYFVGSSEPPADWRSIDFDDNLWAQGNTGIGYGDDDDNTIIQVSLSLYMRKEFTIDNPDDIVALLFHMDYDDGYIAYLNGTEFSRENMGEAGTPAFFNSTAASYVEPALIQGLDLPPVLIPENLILPGMNVLAIQVHNYSISSSDLSAIPFLSLGRADGTGNNLPAYLQMPDQNEYHTNFKISASGEPVLLSSQSGENLDLVQVPSLPCNISYGRQSDGLENFYYFAIPTPEAANTGGFPILAEPPVLTPPPGFYSGEVSVDLGSVPPGAAYFYTLDGTLPGITSSQYSTPLQFNTNTILRVMTMSPDGLNQHFSAYSYFVDQDPHLPVISLIFEPDDFFDQDSGIYILGSGASSEFPYYGANFWQDWERPVHIELFENNGSLTFATSGGVKIFGGWSRAFPQRSLALFARGAYGANEFNHHFFPNLDIDTFEALVLRNSGNDWASTGFRDGMLTGLIKDLDIEHQSFQPSEVYLNGEYWGIYNLREKVNEHFLASHHHINSDNLTLLENDGTSIQGNNSQYLDLMNYVENHNLGSDSEYEFVKERIDIKNFINYQLAQIYFDNRDWPGNNIKFWKPNSPTGKWRWILYDTDFGFGIFNPEAYSANTLEFATDPTGPAWPNPPWSTLLLRKLLNNPDFADDFILSACDLLNDPFQHSTVHSAINQHKDWISDTAPTHFQRWEHNDWSNWNHNISIMEDFALYRPAYMRFHFQEYFGLNQINQLDLNVSPPEAGRIRVHSISPVDYPWSGYYFSDITLDLQALSAPGYIFSHWDGITSIDPDLTINLELPLSLTAVFTEAEAESGEIVINEINYHSANNYDAEDWLELINNSSVSMNLVDWHISDSDNENVFNLEEIVLQPGEYLVLCHDTSAFKNVYDLSIRITGNIDFNFSNGGEFLRLFNNEGSLVDSVLYDDESPWPIEPDGDGPTLELIHPSMDNSLSIAWAASDELGTPGQQNSRFDASQAIIAPLRPDHFFVGPTFPNPFNSQVTIPYYLSRPGSVRLQIYDIRGRLIYSNNFEIGVSGSSNFIWDGKNTEGIDCAAGTYLIQVILDNQYDVIKVALVR